MSDSVRIREGIKQAAEALGISPIDLATAISYETGGTFDPVKAGPTTKWGRHRGLIQFGEPQAQKYGVDWNNPIDSQLGPNGAVVKYLRDAGVRPGMGLLDIYSAINAGSVGRYNASDAHAGGAWGTVRDKVEYQMHGHKAKAQRLFAGDDGVVRMVSMNTGPNNPAVTPTDLAPSMPISRQMERDLAARAAQEASMREQSLWDDAQEAWKRNGMWMWMEQNGTSKYTPDPDWRMSEEKLKELTKDVPEQYWGYFKRAHSEDHANFLREQMMTDLDYRKRIADRGLAGTALEVAGAILDPVGWAVGIAAAPVAGSIKGSQALRILAGAGEGAAVNAAIAIPEYMNRPTADGWDFVYAAAGGAVFGGAITGIFGKQLPSDVADRVINAGKAQMREAEAIAQERVMGAAGADVARGYRDPVRVDLEDFLSKEFDDLYERGSWFDKFRFSISGRLLRSENALTRALGESLVEDAVGRKGRTTPFSVSEESGLFHRRAMTNVMKAWDTSWDDYATRNNLPMTSRYAYSDEAVRFREEASAYIRNQDPMVDFDPAVKKFGDAVRKMLDDYRQHAQNPGLRDGTTRRAIPGFESLDHNPNYIPRFVVHQKFMEKLEQLGEKGFRQKVRAAFLEGDYKLPKKTVVKLADAWFDSHRNRMAGQEIGMQMAWAGRDRDMLAKLLRDSNQFSEDEIKAVMAQFNPNLRPSDASAPARGKNRALLNENYTDGVGFNMTDLFENDALKLATLYSRQMSPLIALARLRVKNPKFGKNGDEREFLIDGITSRAEWDRVMKDVAGSWEMLSPKNTAQRDKDLQRLDLIYNVLTGQPISPKWEGGNVGFAVRMIRDYNYVRAMNSMGFAQIGEFGNALGYAGVRAMIDGIPSLNSFRRSARTGELQDDVAREIEWMFAPGTDWLRSKVNVGVDDWGSSSNITGTSGVARKAEEVMTGARRVTGIISGNTPIMTVQQRFTSQAILAKFVNSKDGMAFRLDRLRSLGLDEDMAKRISQHLEDTSKGGKVTYIDGERAGSKIKKLNTDQWEPEVLAAFTNAMDRVSRRIVQENDIGQMAAWMNYPMAKMLLQFRSFMIGAYEKQFLHNIRMMDMTTFGSFTMTMLMGTVAYMAQQYLSSMGRSDRDAFLEKRLSPEKLAAAAFQRAGWSSIMPMAIDQGMGLLALDPLFDTRASGLPSQGLVSNPTLDLLQTGIPSAIRGVTGMYSKDDPFSQKDARAIYSLMFFQNWWPMMGVFNYMISDLPEKDPRAFR